MRTLLRHQSTAQYFESLDRWTPDSDCAHDFGPISRAIRFARKARLGGLELVVQVDDPKQLDTTPLEKLLRGLLRAKTV